MDGAIFSVHNQLNLLRPCLQKSLNHALSILLVAGLVKRGNY